MSERVSKAFLGLAMGFLAYAAITHDRADWPIPVGDEATYLMAAQSLAWDFDYRYEMEDFQRFIGRVGVEPTGLILQSSDGGSSFAFGKPITYPLFAAPFERLGGTRGVELGNVLLLTFALWCALGALRPNWGVAAPFWLGACVFCSALFAQAFWIHADLFMTSLVVIALSIGARAFQHRRDEGPRVPTWQLATAGALLAIVAITRPFYGTLAIGFTLALFFVLPRRRLFFVASSVVVTGLLLLVVSFSVRDTWSSYAGQRQYFDNRTGYPEVDEIESWENRIAASGTNSWTGSHLLPYGWELRQSLWNAYYYVVGRHVGLLPYFLPALVALLGLRRTPRPWWFLLAAAAVSIAAFLASRPVNFYGGGGALANRYFLPLFPVLWFLPPPPKKLWCLGAIPLVAAPFLWSLWTQPRAFLRSADGGYAFVSSFSERWLPHETTQAQLKPAGAEDFYHRGLWVKPLTPNVRSPEDNVIVVGDDREAQLLLGSPTRLDDVEIRVANAENGFAPVSPRGLAQWREVGPGTYRASLGRPDATHRMWWGNEPVYLYRIALTLACQSCSGQARLEVTPQSGVAGGAQEP